MVFAGFRMKLPLRADNPGEGSLLQPDLEAVKAGSADNRHNVT